MKRSSYLLGVALIVSLVLPGTAAAQVKNVEKIKYPELPELKIADPTRVELDNGMVVLLLEDHELPLIDAYVLIHTGSRLDPPDKIGLAELTGSVLRTGGTTSMPGDDLDDYLEGKAASIEAAIDTDSGSASMTCLKGDFPEVLKVFADVLRSPVFDEDKLEVARNQMVSVISRQNDNPVQIMFREFREVVYGSDSPYTADTTYETAAATTRADLVDWHKKYFHPNRIVLGLVGDFDVHQALALVKMAFGDWKKGPSPEPIEVAYGKETQAGVYYIEKNDMTQSDIIMGHLGIRRDNPDYHAVEVMNQVMSGSSAARLFSNVRTKKGLAYAVQGSVNSNWDHHGLFQMWMTTKTETTAAGIDALLEEARNMTAMPPTEAEVAKAKMGILNSFVFNFDSNLKILQKQITYEYFGYPLDWLTRYREGIEKVTTEEVRRAAAKYIHPDNFAILVVGPAEGHDRPLADFGDVVAVDITIPEPEATMVAATAEGKAKGMALLVKVIEAAGGAARVDSIESMNLSSSVLASTPQGEMQIKSVIVFEFPDRFRQELSLPFGTIINVLTSDDAFSITPQGTQDMADSQRDQAQKSVRRMPLSMLKHRADPGLVALSVGRDEIEGTAVELLQVEFEGDVTLLAIDPEMGRIVRMTYQGQDFTGARGEVVQTFSDFRDVDGVPFPFKTVSTFNGQPFVSATTDSIKLNQPVADDAFARPEAIAQTGGK